MLLDTHSGKVLSRAFVKKHLVPVPQFLQDKNYIDVTQNDDKTFLLNTADLSTYRVFQPLRDIEFSSDHQYLAAVDREGTFYSWNLKTQAYIHHNTLFRYAEKLIPKDENQFIISGFVGEKKHTKKFSAVFSAQGKFLKQLNYVDPYAKLRSDWITSRRGYNDNARYSEDAEKPYLDVLQISTNKVTHHLRLGKP